MNNNSKMFIIFFFVFFFTLFPASLTKCPKKQSEALLLFKHNLSSINYTNDHLDDICVSDYHPKMMSWNTSTDCCKWDGVTCDNSTGDVIKLDLFCGSLQGTIHSDSSLVNLTHLTSLDLSYNKLNGTLPSWLFTSPSLESLDLSDNMFSGTVPFESFALPSLKYLYLSRNQLAGQIDVQTFRQLTNLTGLGLSYNNFSGELELDTLLSSLTNLEVLDLSYSGFSVTTNNTNHYVNPGFGWLELASCKLKVFPNSFRAMKKLQMLDLSSNEIHGQIPHWAGEIGDNELYYLNLSHNFITGLPQFKWYGLSSLYLQSNLIEGPFPPSICNMSYLDILDMSNNHFGGLIPHCFGNITSSLSMIDLGNNRFQGTIPIRDLSSLKVLNLSHNSLSGRIPNSLGNLSEIESLDLSWNQLTGNIPQSLAGIKGLAVLNLSQNHLVGRIPEGTQFSTFDETSFAGNLGLCGFPLPKKCSENARKPHLEAHEDQKEESGFTWEVVILGYGCGTLLGLMMGSYMLSTRKVKWFNAIADAAESLVLKKRKRRHVYIGKGVRGGLGQELCSRISACEL